MNIPEQLRYTKDHEWISVEGAVATIGITEYAQGELGDIVYLDLPDDVDEVAAGDTFGTIEAVKTVADMYAPVSGAIKELHTELNDSPETINSDPYGEGWIIRIEMSDPSELEGLLNAQAYAELIGA